MTAAIASAPAARDEVSRFLKITNDTRNMAIALFGVDVYTQSSSMTQYRDVLALARHFGGIRF